jgi:hypothetical protein
VREELDSVNSALSAAYCERDMLVLGRSQLQIELHETRGEVSTIRRHDSSSALSG